MSFPPLRPSRDSTPSNDPQSIPSGSVRSRQSAWGLSASQSSSRRDLNQLDTAFPSVGSAASARSNNSFAANNNSSSQIGGQFSPSSTISSTGRLSSRNTPSISSTISPFATFQSGALASSSQQQQLSSSQLLSSSRSNTTTPLQQANSASSAAASASGTSQGGGGGGGSGSGGGTNRSNTFGSSSNIGVTSPTSSGFDRNTFTSSSTSGANPNHSSVLKISITQLVLLLGSITEKEGKAKWESQADAIRKVSYHL